MGLETKVELDARQTLEIAQYAVNQGYFTLATDWIRATESKLPEGNDTCVRTRHELTHARSRNMVLVSVNM